MRLLKPVCCAVALAITTLIAGQPAFAQATPPQTTTGTTGNGLGGTGLTPEMIALGALAGAVVLGVILDDDDNVGTTTTTTTPSR